MVCGDFVVDEGVVVFVEDEGCVFIYECIILIVGSRC